MRASKPRNDRSLLTGVFFLNPPPAGGVSPRRCIWCGHSRSWCLKPRPFEAPARGRAARYTTHQSIVSVRNGRSRASWPSGSRGRWPPPWRAYRRLINERICDHPPVKCKLLSINLRSPGTTFLAEKPPQVNDNKSVDVFGIKGVSDSMKIATQGLVDGAGAFLSRLCLPAAEELGLALRDRISAWRATNALRMLNEAHNIYIGNASHQATDRLNPRLVHIAIEEASWIDDTLVQSMWAGLLAASASSERSSDDNLLFMNLLKHLTTLEVKILTIAVERARKTTAQDRLIIAEFAMRLPVRELPELFGTQDLQRLDRELDHLRELGLIAGGIDLSDGHADLTPTPLALHLYVRAHGSRLSPAAYWNLEPPTDGNSRAMRARTTDPEVASREGGPR